jgi:phospholipase C
MPGADPGEGYSNTNAQLFGTSQAPAKGTVPGMTGFVANYAQALTDAAHGGRQVLPGTTSSMIMGCFAPETLPVLSAMARGYAVCDHWFASVPTMTMPNRAFTSAATSQGHMDDLTKSYTAPSIFGLLREHGLSWRIYGYDQKPLTAMAFSDTDNAPAANIGLFTDFQADAAAGRLPVYAFLEPSWSSKGNNEHPDYNIALGEQFLLAVYQAVSSGPAWPATLLIVTYDEHGGCYDHVPPPWGATPPDSSIGEFGFDFTRLGVRVPTVLVSPLIPAGTVFRVPEASTPLDHTSILATVEHRWSLPPLTRRDANAPDVGSALTLSSPRADDPLAGVRAPTPPPIPAGAADELSHLEQVRTELATRLR